MKIEEVHVPGMWKCPHCGFIQQNAVISPVGVFGSKAPELRPCPNDGRDLQPVTWRQLAEENEAFAIQLLDEGEKLKASLRWFIRQCQGDSGTGENYWEQFKEYRAAQDLVNEV